MTSLDRENNGKNKRRKRIDIYIIFDVSFYYEFTMENFILHG